ncbi:MAG: hypothetical protein AAGH17_05115 [Pseudomonadota bacterium]
MHILDIIILAQRISDDGRSVIGKVQFAIETAVKGNGHSTQLLCVDCQTAISARIRPDALLIGDAIRQLRRMPEVRSGAERLSFAKGLNPLQTARAA